MHVTIDGLGAAASNGAGQAEEIRENRWKPATHP